MTATDVSRVARLLQVAFEKHDLGSFGALLAEDVWWGDDLRPYVRRGRSDVLATFSRLVGQGIETKVTEIVVSPVGIVAVMQARWTDARSTRTETALYHAYRVRNGLITQIGRYEARDAALDAIGL